VYSKEEKKLLVHKFWTEFDTFCLSKKFLSGRKKRWMLHRTKVPNVHLRFDPGRNNVQVAIELNHCDEEVRLEMFEKIQQYKRILEEGLEARLNWEFLYVRENGQQVCRIFCEKNGLDMHKIEYWPAIFEFMALNMFVLERNFLEIREMIE
jgi:hypothetical protein